MNTSTDRTSEFISVVQLLKQKHASDPQIRTQNSARDKNGGIAVIRSRQEFNATAKKIGQNLSKTFAKLEKLTLLCKQRNLFDDRPVEISELTSVIHQDIGGLKKAILSLETIGKTTKNMNRKDVDKQMNAQIKELSSRVTTAGSNFIDVIELRKRNIEFQNNRRDGMFDKQNNFAGSGNNSILEEDDNRASLLNRQSSRTLNPFSDNSNNNNDSSTDGIRQRNKPKNQTNQAFAAFENANPNSVLLQDDYDSQKNRDIPKEILSNSNYQDMQMMQQENNYAQERERNMETIESAIVEVGNVMRQLGNMVAEQQDQVMRIDSNIEQAELNIEGAHSEILKYFQSVTNNRWLMMKIMGTIITFFIVFVVFFS